MPNPKPAKVIIDTNIWISFLIGKELQNLRDLIANERIKLILTDQLIDEIKIVTSREKLKKYFHPDKVAELISLLNIISEKIKIKKIQQICRDPKDDFLLALAKGSKADFLVTGDKDLLEIRLYGKTKILTVKEFKEKLK
jgi:putative PIN family toxin of toxin-antitoxin system